MESRQETIQLASGSIPFTVCGTGRPLLYLHPLGGLRWNRALDLLAATHTIYAPVMPGFDATPTHAGIDSGAALGRLAGEFIDRAMGLPARVPCDVMAHSFGGWVALWLAVERPERIDHLVVESPAGFRPADAPAPPADPAAFQQALWRHPDKHLPDTRPPGADAGNPLMRAHYSLPGTTDEALAARIADVRHETLILGGTDDRITPKESQRNLKARLQSAYLIYVYDAAHGIAVDQPERTHQVIESFLTRSGSFIVNWGTAAITSRA